MVEAAQRKVHGAVYTPEFIVNLILDTAGYVTEIRQRHVIDNSCGDGAFLRAVVRRYCESFPAQARRATLRDELATYIHGLDTDAAAIWECRENLDAVAAEFRVTGVEWDIHCASALTEPRYEGGMDFVVGNPPYVRVHNLQSSYDSVKGFAFAQRGMTDLYLVFIELGLRMLTARGKMCLITPSSFLRSLAGTGLRRFVEERRCISKVIDLEHFQAFEATTYTMITLFEPEERHSQIAYYTMSNPRETRFIEMLSYADVFIEGKLYFSPTAQLRVVQEIEDAFARRTTRSVKVKNGFATLADRVFIGDFPFTEGTIPVIKASTGAWTRCIYPYDPYGQPLSLTAMKDFTAAMDYLETHRETLMARDTDSRSESWFLFGRSQGLKDVPVAKTAISSLIRDTGSVKVNPAPPGSGVYGGLYVLGPKARVIDAALGSEDFLAYIKVLKNYKSGGYYAFSSGDVERYLAYVLERGAYEQQRILRGCS